jgi:hypothetical protein
MENCSFSYRIHYLGLKTKQTYLMRSIKVEIIAFAK